MVREFLHWLLGPHPALITLKTTSDGKTVIVWVCAECRKVLGTTE